MCTKLIITIQYLCTKTFESIEREKTPDKGERQTPKWYLSSTVLNLTNTNYILQ